MKQVLERWQRQRKEYGVTTALLEMGYACYREQQYFYGTQEWNDCAKALRFMAGYQCEQCGARDTELHVHHNTPIISAYHRNFRYNFADYRLDVLCPSCHKRIHDRSVRGALSYCFVQADPERVAEYRAELRKLKVCLKSYVALL